MRGYYFVLMLVACSGAAKPVWAQIPVGPFDVSVSGQVGSEYSFRGITQTDRRFGYEGRARIVHGSGFFLDIVGSNVIFANDDTGFSLDLDIGYETELEFMPFATIEIGISNRNFLDFPDASDLNYYGAFVRATYDPEIFSVSVGIDYSPDYYNKSGSAIYYSARGSVPILNMIELSAHAGYQTISDTQAFGISSDSYTDWSATAAWKFLGARAYVSYLGTDLPSEGRCVSDNCGARLVFGASIGF